MSENKYENCVKAEIFFFYVLHQIDYKSLFEVYQQEKYEETK